MQFIAAGLVALIALLVLTGWLSRRAAIEEAISDAQSATELLARSAIQPGMPKGLIDGEAAALDRFDRLVRHRVLGDWLVRVKVWDQTGRIVYSDEPRLIGERFELGAEELTALRESGADAELSDLSEPENRFERGADPLLEVYRQVRSPEGRPLLFEAYYRYSDVTQRGSQVLAGFQPITVGALLVFEALTIPLVWGLALRLRRAREERERLLLGAVEASDRERRRIARDLHDGVVQDLAGASFTLAAVSDEFSHDPGRSATLRGVAAAVRQSIRSLRSLLVEIYPPNLHTEGLAAALADLLATTPGSGLQTSLSVPERLELPEEDASLLWRVAQEAVRNARQHAGATRLSVRVSQQPDVVTLEVEDDGVGFSASAPAADGHVGLRMLRDLVEEHGGRLAVRSSPEAGTTLRLEVPAR